MITAVALLERRLLAAVEQAARVELPASWRGLTSEVAALRPAAGVLLAVAECASRAEMGKRLCDMANAIESRREGRPGGEQDLWRGTAAALDRLADLRQGGTGLLGLELWREIPVPADAGRSLRRFLPAELEVREDFLAELARRLLRALAGRFQERARREGT